MIGLVILLFFGLIVVSTVGSTFTGAFFLSFLLPVCGVFIVIIVLVIAAASGAFRRAPLPPPPPIQQPMVPAGRQPPIAINCPNCGAPPGVVDRFGVATCAHCSTRFIVR